MIRRIVLAAALVACATIVGLAAHQATLVLKSGERVNGALEQGANELTMNVNGQHRAFSWDDVAVIEFQGANPSASELQQLPQTDNPVELERHMIVLRNGTVVHGKLHDISRDGETVTYDPREGGASARRSVSASDVARIYLSAPAARSVFAGVLNPNATGGTTDSRGFGRRRGVLGTVGAQGSAIRVDANRPWTDTGITVRQGDRLTFSSSGQIRVTDGTAPEAVATVDGAGLLQAHGAYPVSGAPAGALIGRIGNSAPFGIGSQTVLTMPASGRLFLGVNDDHFEDNSGAFTVTIGR